MQIIYNELKCKKCGKVLSICEGDLLQIIQESLDILECQCENCNFKNEVEIIKINIILNNNAVVA